jgi:hypothetical protein
VPLIDALFVSDFDYSVRIEVDKWVKEFKPFFGVVEDSPADQVQLQVD